MLSWNIRVWHRDLPSLRLIVSCTVLNASWQKSSFGWRFVGLRLGAFLVDGFFGIGFSSLLLWRLENDAIHRSLYIRSCHRLIPGYRRVIP